MKTTVGTPLYMSI